MIDSSFCTFWYKYYCSAREFVYSETAFLQRLSSLPDESPKFSLRWFTPITEFCLCGHATLASSFILFNSSLIYEITNIIQFETLSGTLTAQRMTDGRIKLNFPADSSTVSGNMEVEVIKTIEKAMSKVAPGFELSLVEMRAGKLGYIIEIGHWIRLKGLKMDMSAFVSLSHSWFLFDRLISCETTVAWYWIGRNVHIYATNNGWTFNHRISSFWSCRRNHGRSCSTLSLFRRFDNVEIYLLKLDWLCTLYVSTVLD